MSSWPLIIGSRSARFPRCPIYRYYEYDIACSSLTPGDSCDGKHLAVLAKNCVDVAAHVARRRRTNDTDIRPIARKQSRTKSRRKIVEWSFSGEITGGAEHVKLFGRELGAKRFHGTIARNGLPDIFLPSTALCYANFPQEHRPGKRGQP